MARAQSQATKKLESGSKRVRGYLKVKRGGPKNFLCDVGMKSVLRSVRSFLVDELQKLHDELSQPGLTYEQLLTSYVALNFGGLTQATFD